MEDNYYLGDDYLSRSIPLDVDIDPFDQQIDLQPKHIETVKKVQKTKKALVQKAQLSKTNVDVIDHTKRMDQRLQQDGFWTSSSVPSDFKNNMKLLMEAGAQGDLQKSIMCINRISKKFVKDTSLTDYLSCLLSPDKFTHPLPTTFKTRHVLVKVTHEFTVASANVISIHWNVGMLNTYFVSPTNNASNNVFVNSTLNGTAPDIAVTNYTPRGFPMPVGFFSSMIPVAAMMKISPEGSYDGEMGRVYVASVQDETVAIENPATYAPYTVPSGYVNQYTHYEGHPLHGAQAIMLPPSEKFMTYQPIVTTSAASQLNGALLTALLVGTAGVSHCVTMTQVLMCKPLPQQTTWLGSNIARPGKTPSCFDLGSISNDYPHLLAGPLYGNSGSISNSNNRVKDINEAVMNIPGVEDDDFWTGMVKTGLLALNAIPTLIDEFRK